MVVGTRGQETVRAVSLTVSSSSRPSRSTRRVTARVSSVCITPPSSGCCAIPGWRVNVAGNDEFIVKVPNSAHHSHLTEGEVVNVGWEYEDCRALDAMIRDIQH